MTIQEIRRKFDEIVDFAEIGEFLGFSSCDIFKWHDSETWIFDWQYIVNQTFFWLMKF